MEVAFEEISILGGKPIPDEYKVMIDAVQALNTPPDIRSAQTSYLFKIEDGAILNAWPSDNPVATVFDFFQKEGWSYALVPHSIMRGGAVTSYSVISKHGR